ncbi:hypothetical protein [Streptomyces atroolivaceus]|uniref:hypothetical protein n=1 Tax=Streptomyces atroolivaceus TaxID=66869 RepID=UPI00379EDCDA
MAKMLERARGGGRRAGPASWVEGPFNHTLSKPADRLCLVLATPPAEDWSAATIHDVFGVHVLWRTGHGWAGRDAETALGAGQA